MGGSTNTLCYLLTVDAENTRFSLLRSYLQLGYVFANQCLSKEPCCKSVGVSGNVFHPQQRQGDFLLPVNVLCENMLLA